MEYVVLKGIIEDLLPKGSHARRREKYDYSRGKRWACMAAADDGADEGWYEIHDDGPMRADDDYYACREEDPDGEWAEQKMAKAEAEMEQAQEALAAMMQSYEESENAQSAVRDQTA